MKRRLGKRHTLFQSTAGGYSRPSLAEIVDQDANRERKATQRHRVQRLTEKIKHHQRGQDRQRN